jgi:hypothetical protein
MNLNEQIQNKWKSVLEHSDLPAIADPHRRAVTAMVLENTERAMRDNASVGVSQSLLAEAPTNAAGTGGFTAGADATGPVAGFDPILISLVRRALPNLIAYDICGVQPMTAPTGLIFAMRSRYANQAGTEAFYNEADTAFSTLTGANSAVIGADQVGTDFANGAAGGLAANGLYNYAQGMTTGQAEALGSAASNTSFAEMAFSIEKVAVEAKTRALKAEYSLELAQDLKAVHGLDAEAELSNILAAEILAEINREVVRTVNVTAKRGSLEGTTTQGIFDLDVDSSGRWSVEKFKGLMFHIEREANGIAKDTRRGKANLLICSSDVASALQMAGVLDYTPALNSNQLNIDDTGATFAGVLNGRFRVYIDPYAGSNYMTVGYKGSNAFDAGLFYCPYVPLQMVRAVDQDTFQPKIGFKTRYGMVANPFAEGSAQGLGRLIEDSNVYYRRTIVRNLL